MQESLREKKKDQRIKKHFPQSISSAYQLSQRTDTVHSLFNCRIQNVSGHEPAVLTPAKSISLSHTHIRSDNNGHGI